MPTSRRVALLLAVTVSGSVQAQGAAPSPSGGDETTGRMLYTAQCSGCHLAQMHWRDRKIAVDWTTLVREVRRWQQNSGLAWGEDEILAVARHLNVTWYHFPSVAGKELAQRKTGSEP
jgi:mono/diheme cytochrome c family protein